jgi:hypothetical protein
MNFVNVREQSRSSLGLEAQAVRTFVSSRNGKIIAPEFVDTESGERNDRPQLQAALGRCKVTRRDVGLWLGFQGESGMARTSCHFRV